jgi:two-component sensor histidine kinase
MDSTLIIILLFSIFFQLTASVYSLYLIKFTGFKYSWIFISSALFLMSIRRAIPLFFVLYHPDYFLNLTNEALGLILSILMLVGVVGVGKIFIDKKVTEDKINSLLKEKDLILREVHHRIKNNMNTTYNLIVLQSDSVEDLEAKKALDNASNRVQAMITLYEELFISGHYSEVSMKNYLPLLTERIIANFPNRDIIKLEVKSEEFSLDEKKLSSLGLIINELLTNTMKYAFEGRANGKIEIALNKNQNKIILTVKDNGNGFVEDIKEIEHPGFGLSLVEALTKQLDGNIAFSNQSGTTVKLEFPES